MSLATCLRRGFAAGSQFAPEGRAFIAWLIIVGCALGFVWPKSKEDRGAYLFVGFYSFCVRAIDLPIDGCIAGVTARPGVDREE
jgi:hypothetical protein